MGIKSASKTRKKPLKILLFGSWGSGKTHFALQATPGATLIFDAESGADFFEGQEGFDFDYWTDDDGLKTASIRELEKAIDALETKEYRNKYQTFIIDPISDIWDYIQDQRSEYKDAKAAKYKNIESRNEAELESFNVKDWGDMKRIYKGLMLRLKNLPQNVILIAREKEILETKADGSLVKTGEFIYEAEKGTAYVTDFALRLVYDEKSDKRWVEVAKSRAKGLKKGEKFDSPTFAVFDEIVNRMVNAEEVSGLSTKSENVFIEEENASNKEKELRDKVITLCRDLGGQENADLMKLLKSYHKSGNPNNIKDESKVEELLKELETMKKEKESK